MAAKLKGASDEVSGPIELLRVRLRDICYSHRFHELDRCEAYYRCKQDEGKQYDWDGRFRGYGDQADITPGWYVPLTKRKPNVQARLAKQIVSRLTSMVFGEGRFPKILIEGDDDAEDYAQELAKACDLPAKMIEARNLGGAQGTACLSAGFKDGKPRLEVHNAKHIYVLEWKDFPEAVVAKVVKAYAYPRRVVDPETGRIKVKDYFYVRYWDDEQEIVWEPIPAEVAALPTWSSWPHRRIEHGAGFTPFYWIQNLPDSAEEDGESDLDGLFDQFDSINRLLSATNGGAIANVDPTLVVHMDPSENDGTVQKGSGEAIFSPGGASYLELEGTSIKAALDLFKEMKQDVLDTAQVVLQDPEKISGKAQSAQAMRILYAPMLAKCDQLRAQYGKYGVVRIVRDLLEWARAIEARPPVQLEDGTQVKQVIQLPKRNVEERVDVLDENGQPTGEQETKHRQVKRSPGTSSEVSLKWPPYFPATWQDIKESVTATKEATGGQSLISQRTGVQAVAEHFGIEDIDRELENLEDQADREMFRAQEMMAAGAPSPAGLGDDPREERARQGGE